MGCTSSRPSLENKVAPKSFPVAWARWTLVGNSTKNTYLTN